MCLVEVLNFWELGHKPIKFPVSHGAIKTNSKTNTAYDLKCADSLGLHFAVQYCGSCLNISKLDLARLAAIVSKRE